MCVQNFHMVQLSPALHSPFLSTWGAVTMLEKKKKVLKKRNKTKKKALENFEFDTVDLEIFVL